MEDYGLSWGLGLPSETLNMDRVLASRYFWELFPLGLSEREANGRPLFIFYQLEIFKWSVYSCGIVYEPL